MIIIERSTLQPNIKHNEGTGKWCLSSDSLDNRKHKTGGPWEENQCAEAQDCPSLLHREFPGCSARQENSNKACRKSTWAIGHGWELKEATVFWNACMQNSRERRELPRRAESSRNKSSGDLQAALECLAECDLVHAFWANYTEAGKRTCRNEWAEQSLEFTQAVGYIWLPPVRVDKSHDIWIPAALDDYLSIEKQKLARD